MHLISETHFDENGNKIDQYVVFATNITRREMSQIPKVDRELKPAMHALRG